MMWKFSLFFQSIIITINCDKILPSSPEVIYGGFKPILYPSDATFSETRRSYSINVTKSTYEQDLRLNNPSIGNARKTKSLMLKDKDTQRVKKALNFRRERRLPFHKDSSPTFPLCKFFSRIFFFIKLPSNVIHYTRSI